MQLWLCLLCYSPLLSIESFIFHVEIRNRILCTVDRTLINDWRPHSNPVSRPLEPTLATMVSPSTAPIMLNHSRLSDEIFSANVAALRENLDHMFVLLMGAITCFLQVFTFFIFWKNIHIREAPKKKKRENVGILKKQGGGGLPKSHFFCNLTKWFLACQTQSSTWEKFQHFPVFFGKTSLSLPDFFLEHLNFFSIKAAIQA